MLQEMKRILNDFLSTLTDRQLYTFIWRYYYNDSVKNIGRMLDMSETTVRRELSSIRAELKEHLIKGGFEYETK